MYLIVTKGVTGIFVYPVEAENGDLAFEKVKPELSKYETVLTCQEIDKADGKEFVYIEAAEAYIELQY